MEALVEGAEAKEFSNAVGGGGAASAAPIKSAGVVGAREGGAFSDVKAVGATVLVENGPSQLEIRVGNVALGVAPGNKAALDVAWEREAPNDRVGLVAATLAAMGAGADRGRARDSSSSGEPNATGPMAGSVMVAMNGGLGGDQFKEPSGAVVLVSKQMAEVVQDEVNRRR